MNERPFADTELDRRLRRLYGRLDATPGFTARVLAQAEVARSRADQLSRRELREHVETDRAHALARLRARLWRLLAITLSAGLAASAAAFVYGGAVGGVLMALGHGANWTIINFTTVGVLTGWLWLMVRTAARGGAWRRVAS
ncbi:MAG TPA: hypothetical protein VN790_08945 [Steroidobacteraceae bacterium]|nr:hypothetical protein [Steroidobacteraceae bacterium]